LFTVVPVLPDEYLTTARSSDDHIYTIFFFFFFFFQAEDGIRDGHVTGVQTCALPISPSVLWEIARWLNPDIPKGENETISFPRVDKTVKGFQLTYRLFCITYKTRSEERRVGKECRY